MQTTTDKNKAIVCSWTGRHADRVKVIGATSLPEAREHALIFAECPEGITLDDGHLMTWTYEEPKPADREDYYIFWSCDAHPVDQREWWEK